MTEYVKLRIVRNKSNNQINLNPRRRDIPQEFKKKFDVNKFMKLKWENIDFE